ncbi:transposable element Tc1 transposase [Trichonephila clavipes]|nr:transposable element Tc1 transposase [Trichonephila clavipes]
MVWGAISYHERSNLLRIERNLNSNYFCEVLQHEVVPFLQGIPEAIFRKNNEHRYVGKTVRDFCSVQLMQLLPWSAYSPDMSPIEHGFGLSASRTLSSSRSFKRRTFAAHTSNMEFSSTGRHSKSV